MKIAITGSSGLLGRALISQLRLDFRACEILGLDVVAPKEEWGQEVPDHFKIVDVTKVPTIEDALTDFNPDTLIHLAFIVTPMHDSALQRSINVDGTKNVVRTAGKFKVKQLLVASSATAYG